MGLTEHINSCGWQIPLYHRADSASLALIKHWCVCSHVLQSKNLYQTDKGKHWCNFGELYVGASLLRKAVFTASMSLSYCLRWDWVWIAGGAKAVWMPQGHWLVPLFVFSVWSAPFDTRYVKRSQEITKKKHVDGEPLVRCLCKGFSIDLPHEIFL